MYFDKDGNLVDEAGEILIKKENLPQGVSFDYTPRKEADEEQTQESLFALDKPSSLVNPIVEAKAKELDPQSEKIPDLKSARPTGVKGIENFGDVDIVSFADKLEAEATSAKAKDDGSLDYRPSSLTPEAMQNPEGFIADIDARSKVKPIRIKSDEELEADIAAGPENPNYNNAWNEKLLRAKWAKMSFMEKLSDPDWVSRKASTLARQALTGAPNIPSDVSGLLGVIAAPSDLARRKLGLADENEELATEGLMKFSQEWNDKVNEIAQVNNPESPDEMLAKIAGGAVVPVGGELKAASPLTKIAEAATPLTIGGAKSVLPNIGLQFLGEEALRPLISNPGDPYQTIFQRFLTPDAAEAQGKDASLDFHVGAMPDGAHIKNSDLTKLSVIGLATLAIGASPSIIKAWGKNRTPTSRLVDDTGFNAPKGLSTIEKGRDLFKTYLFGQMSGLFSLMKRAGVNNEDLFDAIETDTISAQRMKLDNAIESGSLRTLDGDWSVDTSPAMVRSAFEALDKEHQELANQHALLLDLVDSMKVHKVKFAGGWKLSDAIAKIREIEQSFPEVVNLHNLYKKVKAADLAFTSSGEGALFTKAKAAKLRRQRPNYVPVVHERVDPSLTLGERATERELDYGRRLDSANDVAPFTMRRDLSHYDMERQKPYDVLIKDTRNHLREKMDNAARIRIIDAMRNSRFGKNSVIRVSEADLKKHPEWRDRTTTVFRKGKKEYYVTTRLLGDLIRFDPNFARAPWIFNLTRTFQQGTTGYLAPWFAVKQFLRDSYLIPVTQPPGFKRLDSPVIPLMQYGRSAFAVFNQLYRQGQKGLSDAIYHDLTNSPSGSLLQSAFGNNINLMRALADNLAYSYQNSPFFAAMQGGGVSFGMTKNALREAHTGIDEALRDTKLPPHLKAAARAWKNTLDAIQNGPRFAWFLRNYQKGVPKAKLNKVIKEARDLSGDVTVGGITYRSDGRQISSDLSSRNLLTAAIPRIGRLTASARQWSPWFNATVRSLRRVSLAYWNNPWTFVGRMYMSVMVPTTMAFWWAWARTQHAKETGQDIDFTDYMLTQRSEYDKSTSLYIAPFTSNNPEDGYEIPLPLEIAPVMYLYMNLLDHVFRNGSVGLDTIMQTVGSNFFDLTMPVPAVVGLGALGIKSPSSIFFGESAYSPKENPNSALPENVELVLKGLWGAASGIAINGLQAFLDGDYDVLAAMKEMAYQVKEKTPLIQDKKLTAWTDLNEGDLEFVKKLDQLEAIHRSMTGEPKDSGEVLSYGDEEKLIPDLVPNTLKSGKAGKKLVPDVSGGVKQVLPNMSGEEMGMDYIPPATNPIYLALMDKIHDLFEKRSNNYGKMTNMLSKISMRVKELRLVNAGNINNWKERIEALEDDDPVKQLLSGLDLSSRDAPRQAMNILEKKRTKVLKTVKLYIKEAEDNLLQELKQKARQSMLPGVQGNQIPDKIDLMTLDPYSSP